ncbi:MAG: hypothetical protein BWZ10_02609 [candidate division BRC1 bacterium ADurb.BinA364]|nr:MAG: hypothetical protein BWZ10_02609 [candidate division BRC1 bacterium ADurb.BinA364]
MYWPSLVHHWLLGDEKYCGAMRFVTKLAAKPAVDIGVAMKIITNTSSSSARFSSSDGLTSLNSGLTQNNIKRKEIEAANGNQSPPISVELSTTNECEAMKQASAMPIVPTKTAFRLSPWPNVPLLASCARWTHAALRIGVDKARKNRPAPGSSYRNEIESASENGHAPPSAAARVRRHESPLNIQVNLRAEECVGQKRGENHQ